MPRFTKDETPAETAALKLILAKPNGLPAGQVTVGPATIGATSVRVEDSGCAVLLDIEDADATEEAGVRFCLVSWDEERRHHLARSFIGKRVEVTIRVVS